MPKINDPSERLISIITLLAKHHYYDYYSYKPPIYFLYIPTTSISFW